MKFKSLWRRTPLGELLPFLKSGKRVMLFFLCPRVEKFGKCLQSTGGLHHHPLPRSSLRLSYGGFPWEEWQEVLTGVSCWCGGLWVEAVVMRGGSGGTSGLMIAGPIRRACGLNVCLAASSLLFCGAWWDKGPQNGAKTIQLVSREVKVMLSWRLNLARDVHVHNSPGRALP